MSERLANSNFPQASFASSLAAAVQFLWPGRASEDFQWFSTLGWPDVKGRPFVRIANKEEWVREQRIPAQKRLRGFLLEESLTSWTVFSTNLRTMELSRNDPSGLMEEADLLQDASEYLDFLGNPKNWDSEDGFARFGPGVHQAVEVFVLAWACERNGHRRMARRLYKQANVMREGRPRDKKLFGRLLTRAGQWMSRAPGRPSLRQQLEDDLSTAWMWQTVLLFQIPTVPWQNLLRRFEALVKNFPRSTHLAQAQKYAVTLKQMLRGDEEHAKVAQATDGPNRQQQIQELIFQLRNQNGVQREQPGGCDIFADPRGEASSAHQLLKLSMEALPELIRAFDQTSLTRSVGYQRDSVFSHRVLTVGECAKIIVQTMFGRSFPAPDDSVGNPGEMATAWWNEAREKGLSRLLVEAVEQGKEGSARQAELLFATDPAALAAALPMGFDRALEPWVKRDLVQIAARIPGEEIIPFLQQRLQSRNLQWAVMAAWGLHKRGDPNVVATMIQRWKAKLSDGQDGEEGVDHLIAFLVASADENAISALASDLPQRSATLRRKVIETLADGALPFWLDLHYSGLWSEQMRKKLSPRTFEILEQLLVSSLEDTAEGNWTIIGPNGKSMQNPRVCDYAGKLLAEQWKPKYQFDFWASQAERDKQRLECINVWRKENAMPMG